MIFLGERKQKFVLKLTQRAHG